MPATNLHWFEKTRLYKRLGLSCSACAVPVVFCGFFISFDFSCLLHVSAYAYYRCEPPRLSVSQGRDGAEKPGSLIGPPFVQRGSPSEVLLQCYFARIRHHHTPTCNLSSSFLPPSAILAACYWAKATMGACNPGWNWPIRALHEHTGHDTPLILGNPTFSSTWAFGPRLLDFRIQPKAIALARQRKQGMNTCHEQSPLLIMQKRAYFSFLCRICKEKQVIFEN